MTKEEFLENVNFQRYPKYELSDIHDGKPDRDIASTVLTENGKIYLAKYVDGKWQQAHITSGGCQQIYYTDIDDNVIYWLSSTEERKKSTTKIDGSITDGDKYNAALLRARIWKNRLNAIGEKDYATELNYIFPELKENKVGWIEKIGKELKTYLSHRQTSEIAESDAVNEWISWLEKQGGEQKQEDVEITTSEPKFTFNDVLAIQCCMETVKKVQEDQELYEQLKLLHSKVHDAYSLKKPKFKVGDWVVNNNGKVNQVVSVGSDGDGYTLDDDTYFSGSWGDLYHLWTIEDAKEGDILAAEEPGKSDAFIAIYKGRGLDFFNSHCFVAFDGKFYEGETGHSTNNIHPATKEQRSTLFEKMKESGFEWDADKKELKNIRLSEFIDRSCEFISQYVQDYIDVKAAYPGDDMKVSLQQNFIDEYKKHMKSGNKNKQ